MTFVTQADLAQDPTFLKRVREAALTAALQIYAELSSVAGHGNRAAYASRVLNGQVSFGVIADAVCTNSVITAASLDSDIQFQVNAVWNALAGA